MESIGNSEFTKYSVRWCCPIITTSNNQELEKWNMREFFFIFLQLIVFGSSPVISKAVLQVTSTTIVPFSDTHSLYDLYKTTSRIMATLSYSWESPLTSLNLLRSSRSWSSFWQKPVQVSTEQPGRKFLNVMGLLTREITSYGPLKYCCDYTK